MATRRDDFIAVFKSQGVDSVVRDSRRFSSAMAEQRKQSKELTNAFRFMRGGLGQLGYQIQDISVQLQGGQSPFVVLAQQGSQIASLFGPYGAVTGAILAVGAAIGGTMLPQLFKTRDVIKELDDSMDSFSRIMRESETGAKELSDEMLRLAEISKDFAYAEYQAGIVRANKAVKLSNEALLESFNNLSEVGNITQRMGDFIKKMGSAAKIGQLSEGTVSIFQDMGEYLGFAGNEAEQMGVRIAKMLAMINADPSVENFKMLQTLFSELTLSGDLSDQGILFASSLNQIFLKAYDASEEVDNLNKRYSTLAEMLTKGLEIKIDLKSQNEFIANLRKQVDYYGASESVLTAVQAVEMGITGEKLAQVVLMRQQIDAMDEQKASAERYQEVLKNGYAARDKWLKSDAEKMTENHQRDLTYMQASGMAYEELMVAKSKMDEEYAQARAKESDLFIGSMNTLKTATNDALSMIIKQGASVNDVLKSTGDIIVTSVIGGFANMATEWIKQQITMRLFSDSSRVVNLTKDKAQALATATAWSTPAALVSLATQGANSVPAQAGIASTVASTAALSSFEGGGYTGYGSRVGGMDGRGGFLAMLHPNETVIDHTKNNGRSGNNITINFGGDSGGFERPRSRRQLEAAVYRGSAKAYRRNV